MNLFPFCVPSIVLTLADIFLGEHECAETFLREKIDIALSMVKEGILLSVSLLQKFLHDGIGTLAKKFNIPGLLVLNDDRHAFACAIELEYVKNFVFQSVALAVLNY